MRADAPIQISDTVIRPRSSRELVTCFIAERMWQEPGVTDTFETILPPLLSEYGIVHAQIVQTLEGYFAKLGDNAAISDFAEFPTSGRVDFKETILGSDQPAEAFNSILRRHLSFCGILQPDDWPEQKGPLPTLPVIPWLLFRGAVFSDKRLLNSTTSAELARALATERSLPKWIREKIVPQNCERYVRRLKDALVLVRKGRLSRFNEAGGNASEMASALPELAIMYPKSLQTLGATLLDLDKLKSVLEWIPNAAYKKHMAAKGVHVDFRPALSPAQLAKLGLLMAGIRPQALPVDFTPQNPPNKPALGDEESVKDI
ncbi:hypothetical protein DES53_111100 [Roseimicrobium gellanilyticum]|uniref:Uncharacterized protein n=1 Tax=Roseimicrobium gellanilyticum TaxID=748857 RepID=A0A366HAH5_9BACT|nr:hypothetical protein [Roseimicrobium gellanilyticum]RBP38582.1 hypothetical protein DES53_111100 [Roseimicrobium gellanilyticum]